jgi:hypothetical protein
VSAASTPVTNVVADLGLPTNGSVGSVRDDFRVALEPLSVRELAESPTVFASFMGEADSRYKTVGELLGIYRERRSTLDASEDDANDLRVERFMDDMASNRWNDDVVVRIGIFGEDVLVIDGIHRGIAYLGCVEDGISPERLPALQVNR